MEPAAESYEQQSRNAFKELKATWNALHALNRDVELQPEFDRLFSHFAERECFPEGPDNFTLKNAHQTIVADFTSPEFHEALMQHFMQSGEEKNPEHEHIRLLAEEFDANRSRRLGFHSIKDLKDTTAGEPLVAEALQTFQKLLMLRRGAGDLTTQKRLLYEIGYVHFERGEWNEAVACQEESALVAEQQNDAVGVFIARLTGADAAVRGHIGSASDWAGKIDKYTRGLLAIASAPDGPATAKRWVSNAYLTQAQICLWAANEALANQDQAQANQYRDQGLRCTKAILEDEAGFLAALGEARNRLIPETTRLAHELESVI
ncbi:hypothetical protein FJZ27_04720 [Candidatus Peribacteria bacterium]|nr:hypothetical protein [Candidatus Peribacteria bacterium]